MMHIVYVTWLFAKSEKEVLEGGIPNYLYKMASYMQKKGHRVTIVTTGRSGCQWNYKGIPVHTIKNLYEERGRYADRWLVPIFREVAFRKALKEINSKNPITIVQYAAGYGTGMLHDRRFPSVLRVSTYSRYELKEVASGSEYQSIVLYEKWAAKSFDYIFSPSKVYAIPLSQEIGKTISIIPTPYEIEEDMVEDTRVYDRILKGKKYFLFFGRIQVDKGILTIARCIKDILSRHPDYYICFAGFVGSYEGQNLIKLLRQSAGEYKNRVIYTGKLKHPQLYPLVRHAECVLMPSLADSLPNACLEALFLNGIVIGTKGASFDEIYVDGESGYLIEIDNSNQLTQAVDRVVSMSEEEKERMRRKAKEILKKYTFRKAGGQLERYYQWVVSRFS